MLEYNSAGTVLRTSVVGGSSYDQFYRVNTFTGGFVAYSYSSSIDGDLLRKGAETMMVS